MRYVRLRNYIQKDTVISHLVAALIRILRHYLSQTVVSILGTIVIAVLISNGNYGIPFWICCCFYIGLMVGIAFCGEYDQSLKEDLLTQIKMVKADLHDQEVLNSYLLSINPQWCLTLRGKNEDSKICIKRISRPPLPMQT